MGFGFLVTKDVSSIHAAQVQSDGLANGFPELLHAVHLLYFFVRHLAGVACFILACQSICTADQTSQRGDAAPGDRWGE